MQPQYDCRRNSNIHTMYNIQLPIAPTWSYGHLSNCNLAVNSFLYIHKAAASLFASSKCNDILQ